MIQQFRFDIAKQNSASVPSDYAYKIYSALMEQIPIELADRMHEQGYTGLSQSLIYHKESQKSEWRISILEEELLDVLSPILHQLQTITLHDDMLQVSLLEEGDRMNAHDFILRALQISDSSRVKIQFFNATAFKSNGKYAIFPSEELILNSLLKRWNTVFPESPLEYDELFPILSQGLRIEDYRLSSCRYHMKNTYIPAFRGEITIRNRLSPPIMEIWKLLLLFGSYTGVGIKTTLGMGGIQAIIEHS